jgi:hypothetical protein
MTKRVEDVPAHFWSKIDIKGPDDCWLWEGCLNGSGYGHYGIHRVDVIAHRFAYMLAKGYLEDGDCVCHSCDNPRCCNPNHLWVGTNRENTIDKLKKGRHPKGEKSIRARLKQSEVDQIRQMYATGNYTTTVLGEMFHCSATNIGMIVQYKRWPGAMLEKDRLDVFGF